MASILDQFALARRHHDAGNLTEAERLYQQITRDDPANFDAWALLGAVHQSQNKSPEADQCYHRALQISPRHAMAQTGLGILFAQRGQWAEAAAAFERVLCSNPNDADAQNNLGIVLGELGRLDEAIACFERAVATCPNFEAAKANLMRLCERQNIQRNEPAAAAVSAPAEAVPAAQNYLRHGIALVEAGRHDEAQAYFEQALTLQPNLAEAQAQLGHVLVRQRNNGAAIVRYRKALQFQPDFFEAEYMLAVTLQEQGEVAQAVDHFLHAALLQPRFPALYNNLSNALQTLGRLDEALDSAQQAIRLKPDFAEAYGTVGCAYMKLGRLSEAMQNLKEALRLKPDMPDAGSNLVFCMNYDPEATPDSIFAAHRQWGQMHGSKTDRSTHPNVRDPARRLRIGYVSPDFRHHAVPRYSEPVLANHDAQQVEVYCYAEVAKPDAVTLRLQKLAHHWRVTCGQTDTQMAKLIRDDQIDILVDLAGHTAGNRLLVFENKPAPVQATWLGYLNTTGLTAVDYRLSDSILDLLDAPQRDTEEVFRLPGGFNCFAPPSEPHAVTPLPALERGHLTFGSLHNAFKLNAQVFDLWSKILHALPTARLLMYRDTLTVTGRDQVRRHFAQRGIQGDRLDLRQWTGAANYDGVFTEIDVCLDAFPFTGGVTTSEALWMGVPLISLCGTRPVGRHSASLLTRVGLGDWIVQTRQEYFALAVRQANELHSLATLRSELRERVVQHLCDGAAFTRELETAYRAMWRRWCDKQA